LNTVTAFTPTIVVTGAGSGIGQAVALKFLAEGWQAGLVGRRPEALLETIEKAGQDAAGRCAIFACDVSDADSVRVMAAAVLDHFGRIDVLVNSAGINVRRRALGEVSAADWRAVLATNLDGAFFCTQASRGTCLCRVQVRPDGSHAADQRRGAHARHPGDVDLPARRQHAAARSPAVPATGWPAREDAPAGGPRGVRVAGGDVAEPRDRRRNRHLHPLIRRAGGRWGSRPLRVPGVRSTMARRPQCVAVERSCSWFWPSFWARE
jgi:hypothetical protein